MNALAQHIVSWLKDYADQSKTNGWVVGVSGGIDSAVTSTLCAHTGLPTCVVEMPIHQHIDQVGRAQRHMDALAAKFPNVSKARVDLTEVYDGLVTALPESSDASGGLALANSRARLRMTTLYALAAQRGALVAGTGNKVEDFGVGFYTKYGDGGVDLSPIADLVKTEVFALGAALGVDESFCRPLPRMGFGEMTAQMRTSWERRIRNWNGQWPTWTLIQKAGATASAKSWPFIPASTGPISTK
jgi:NAD+ synthase